MEGILVQEVFFQVFVLLMFAAVGDCVRRLILRSRALNWEFVFVIGLCVAVLFTSFSYQFGLSAFGSGVVFYIFSIILIFLRLKEMYRNIKARVVNKYALKNCSTLIPFFVFLSFVHLPKYFGGDRFAVFQGNHWDQLSYIGISQSVSRYSFSDLLNGSTSNLILQDPVTVNAINSMRARPNVEIMYAALIRPLGFSLVNFAYTYQLILLSVLLFTVIGFIKHFSINSSTAMNRFSISVISVVFLMGFWGQYLVDINAWSALSISPLILFLFVAIDVSIERPNFYSNAQVFLALVTTALLYPEATLFMVPFFALFLLIRVFQEKHKSIKLITSYAGISIIAISVLMSSYFQPIQFGYKQFKFGNSSASEPWGEYFQAFLSGGYGSLSAPIQVFVYSIPMGITGMYFMAPSRPGIHSLFEFLKTTFSIYTISMLVVFFLIAFRTKRRTAIFLSVFPALFLIPLISKYSTIWVAGKALNYLMPVFFSLVVILTLDSFRQSRLILKFFVGCFVLMWMISQVIFAVNRVTSVQAYGIPHSRPYVSIQDSSMKVNQNWSLSSEQFARCKAVELSVVEPFQRHFLQMKLNEFGIPWYDLLPINSYFGVGSDIGTMKKLSIMNKCTLVNLGDPVKHFVVTPP